MSELPICGIGASAGGLDPLGLFFDEMPVDSGMTFVVVQHLSPDHESLMPELLARRTTMPVTVAKNGERVESNRVYLIPPATDMTIEGGHLHLRARERRETPPRPIDTFFTSLAEHAARKVAVVLSGTGRDGSKGIKHVRRAGGLVLAQDQSASFLGMPDAARETGAVHASLPSMDLPGAILEWVATGALPEERSSRAVVEELETSNEELNASNEELIASNEELQTTNEELSSVNEELRTLNDEYHSKVHELSTLNGDLDALLASTELSIVFLGPSLELRRYTPSALAFFKVRPNDLGRPFDEIATTMPLPGLSKAILRVHAGEVTEVEQNIESSESTHLLRVVAYGRRAGAGVVIILVDLTEILRLRAELEIERARFHSFVNHSPAAVFAKTPDGRFVLANERAARSMGYKAAAELVGRYDHELIDQRFLGPIQEVDRHVLSTGEPLSRELAGAPTAPDNTWMSTRFRFYDTSGKPLLGAMSVPTSDIQLLNEARQEADQLRRWLSQAGVTALHMRDGRYRMPDGTTCRVHALDERTLSALQRHEVEQATLRLHCGGDTWRWHEVCLDDDGLVLLCRDVHEVQSELHRLRQQQERARADARARQKSLLTEVDVLRMKNQELDRFAQVAAHDLNAPVRSVRAFAELALMAVKGGDDPSEFVEQVLGAAERMTGLLESLLAFAAAGAFVPTLEQIELSELVDTLKLDLAHEIQEVEGTLHLEAEVSLWADPTAVRQILQNFVTNALKFGGDEPAVLIRTFREKNGSTLAVTDTGIGFDQQRAAQIFEPFTRLHSTRQFPGTGIGLSICKRMVEGHGGRIWAVSAPGEGTTVSAWFPEEVEP